VVGFFFALWNMAKNLSDKQKLFIEEYLVDLNATQAALRAGYAPKRAYAMGHENLRKPEIAAALSAAMAERSERTKIDQDRVVLEIARLAFSDVRKLFDGTRLKRMDEIDDATAAAISSVKVSTRQVGEGEVEHIAEIKFWPKTTALEQAGKHIGLFGADNLQKKPEVTQNVYQELPPHVVEMIKK
jgi:phage terminase small subunit